MPSSQNKPSRFAVWTVIIGALAAILGGLLAGPLILELLRGTALSSEQITVRVGDPTGASLQGAKVIIFFQDGLLSQFTDSSGGATFNVTAAGTGRLIVESAQYSIYEQDIQFARDKDVNVRLSARQTSSENVIFRVVDDSTNLPIIGANVLLLAQGDTLSQATDSNGISKFTLAFPAEGKIDAQMSVSTNAYEISYQHVTLLPNRVQDVRLNPDANGLTIAEISIQQSDSPSSTKGPVVMSYDQSFSSTISDAGETDIYTFNGQANELITIRIARLSGKFCPGLRLYAPGNDTPQTVGSFPGCGSAELTQTLEATGVYTIMVEDSYSHTETGDYNLHLQKVR